MRSFAVVALALSLAPPVARAQQADTSSGNYGRSAPRKSKNRAGAKIGGQPSNPPERVDLNLDRAPARQPPSLAQPTREEILEAQQRGRIRDRGLPDWVRGPQLTELEIPNPFQAQEAIKNPYRHRQDDVKP